MIDMATYSVAAILDGNLSKYFNASWNRAMGKEVVTGQHNFAQGELDYIATHWVYLDHDQRLTGSGGVSYTLSRQNRAETGTEAISPT
jgi:hypothetical protein